MLAVSFVRKMHHIAYLIISLTILIKLVLFFGTFLYHENEKKTEIKNLKKKIIRNDFNFPIILIGGYQRQVVLIKYKLYLV